MTGLAGQHGDGLLGTREEPSGLTFSGAGERRPVLTAMSALRPSLFSFPSFLSFFFHLRKLSITHFVS